MSSVYTKISQCRVCGNSHLAPVVDLGLQCLSGIFPDAGEKDPPESPLELVICDATHAPAACGTVQLKHSARNSDMYGATYGYQSSTSPSMRQHLAEKVSRAIKKVSLLPGDRVLDIGCNDGTLLNNYGKNVSRFGMDPSSQKFAAHFESDIRVIYDFFCADRLIKEFGKEPFRIITSIAMFYDLEDPVNFMRDIRSVLAVDGIWIFELSYLPLMLSQLTYDQICHEHLTYLGLTQIQWMASKAGLRIVDARLNDMNGGSIELTAVKQESSTQANHENLEKLLSAEKVLSESGPYERFRQRIADHQAQVQKFFVETLKGGKEIYGYGASTKGNIILNACGIGPESLPAISDLQAQKYGRVTPGTRIPIISREEMHKANPDYLFVLIWHLRDEVIRDEKEYLDRGGKLVFHLPRLHIVDRDNYTQYLGHPFSQMAFDL